MRATFTLAIAAIILFLPPATCLAEDAPPAPAGAQEKKPLKVYIMAGQSNMTGMVKTNTLEHIKMFPETAKEFEDLFNKDRDHSPF